MTNLLAKTPFFRLLLPLSAGIILQYYFSLTGLAIPLLFFGLGIMLISYFIPVTKQYAWRWLFGAGLYLIIFSQAIIVTSFSQRHSAFTFPDAKEVYRGVVIDIPQIKPNSIACKIELDSKKKIACNFQTGVRSSQLKPGDEVLFYGQIKSFKQFGDPDEFNYPRYMYNKGFSGTAYLFSENWEATGKETVSLPIMALKCREKILQFYSSLGLDETEYGVLSALTLGYTEALTHDIKQLFRATGTAHVLAVSGMHVGIVYAVIILSFSLFLRRKARGCIPQILVIFLLWGYAFITGLPPSVIRAVIMLSVFCIARMFRRKGFTYNNIALAAFVMLLYEPFWLFDLSFQLSFTAVLSIRFFQPLLSQIIPVKGKCKRLVWSLFTLSIAAQLGTFPLCLYYFGTFPTYFFITNLLIVPLVTIIAYTIIVVSVANILLFSISEIICRVLVGVLKLEISLLMAIVRFFESLPFSQIEDIRISFVSTLLLIAFIICGTLYLLGRKAKMLIVSLGVVLLMLLNYLSVNYVFSSQCLTIYSKEGKTEFKWAFGQRTLKKDYIDKTGFTTLGDKVLYVAEGNVYSQGKPLLEKPVIDYLLIVKSDTISLYSLTQTFEVKNVILESSLSASKRKKIMGECEKIGIPCHDMYEKGMFRSNF